MATIFRKIAYESLNSRQREGFNFQKVSAVLADYGFTTIRLTSDWNGADFIAQHSDGVTFLKIQLKGRCAFSKDYSGKDLHICFPEGGQWYLYPHDEVLKQVLKDTEIGETVSWKERGGYSFPTLSKKLRQILQPFRLVAEEARGVPSS
jgi:hypothetical protein